MKRRILQNGRLTPAFEEQLAAEFDLSALWNEADPAGFLAAHGAEFVGLVTSGGVGADEDLMQTLPALQVIASRGVGYEKIDLNTAKRRGIAVSNTPDVLTDCVADMAVGGMIALVRKICLADRFVRQGEWLKRKFPLTTKVSRKKLGIVGLGRIGQAIAQRAKGFAMDIRYHSRQPVAGSAYPFETSLLKLAEWADFLIICTPGGAETRQLVSREVLKALGTGGYLVNISRGSVVDEPALVNALEDGLIAGAALDVFVNEPKVPENLLTLDNVVLLPHIASSTQETFAAMENLVLDNLRSFFTHGRLLTPVE